jgi:hypothetical protein
MHNADRMTPATSAPQGHPLQPALPPHQGLSHQESRRWPSALGARARPRGWPEAAIAILDDALGLTAASAAHRQGCHPLVAPGTLEQVGRMLSSDVTRLARHGADGYPRVDVWGYTGGVIGDGDGMYDPATVHGRLL